ncbi:enoyl-CoA hydratase-related protein [Phaeospirillum tilakii]|uniref:Enoyl-CoA hydratase-related protein n=1 Tax=Phaeospirillum tilakii TaxID=741673 RepID=A0ABW5CGP6_9PROT
MTEAIRLDRAGAVATVLLDRPDRLNALDLPMWRGLAAAFTTLAADDSVRVVVLRGAGTRAFASGADIDEFDTVRSTPEQTRAYDAELRAALQAIRTCPQPVVAAIWGPCVGGGLELACCCDLRLSARSGRFGVPINRLGLAMAHPELDTIRRIVGPAITLELLLEGRLLDADEALAKGLVTRVVADEALEAEIEATTRRLAETAPLSHRWHKAFLRRLDDPTPLTRADEEETYRFLATEDYAEGLAAFRARRKPVFTGR